MRKALTILSVILACYLSGCAYSGSLAPLPLIQNGESAEVILIRESAFTNGGASFIINLNGIDVFAIANGSYEILHIPSGDHTLIAKIFGSPETTKDSVAQLSLSSGERKYFSMSPTGFFLMQHVTLREASVQEGEELLKKSKRNPT